jgi:hypothetical protein
MCGPCKEEDAERMNELEELLCVSCLGPFCDLLPSSRLLFLLLDSMIYVMTIVMLDIALTVKAPWDGRRHLVHGPFKDQNPG